RSRAEGATEVPVAPLVGLSEPGPTAVAGGPIDLRPEPFGLGALGDEAAGVAAARAVRPVGRVASVFCPFTSFRDASVSASFGRLVGLVARGGGHWPWPLDRGRFRCQRCRASGS